MELTEKSQILIQNHPKVFNENYSETICCIFPFSWFKNTDICSEK